MQSEFSIVHKKSNQFANGAGLDQFARVFNSFGITYFSSRFPLLFKCHVMMYV
jgi:hypothetical protein